MYKDDFNFMLNAAKIKTEFCKNNPAGFFISSLMAGAFIGIGIFLSFTVGSLLSGEPYAKILMGAAFSVALSLVIIAGAELFTGSNLIMSSGLFTKTIKLNKILLLWLFCYIGNWLGSIIISAVFLGTGLASNALSGLINAAAAEKTSLDIIPLFFRAVLCNMLVCLAVWSSMRSKSESGKLIIIFWCILAFVTTGFEHCIANMTLLTVSLMIDGININAYLYNIFIATLGNMVGGIFFVGLPYYLIAKEKTDRLT